MRRLLVVEFALVAALGVLASLGFARVFAGASFVMPVVGAALLPMAVAAVSRWAKAGSTTALLWSALGFAAFTTYAALSATAPNVIPTLDTVRELSRGLTTGWAELLSTTLPADTQPRLLVASMALVWFGSALAGEFTLRHRNAVTPVVPALVVYLFTLGFSASRPQGSLLLPVLISAVLLAVLLVHANRWASPARRRPVGVTDPTAGEEEDSEDRNPVQRLATDTSARRWIALGIPVIVVAVAAAAVVAPRLPGRDGRFDPRSLRQQQLDVQLTLNPLDGLKAELAISPEEAPVRFTIQTSGGGRSGLDRVRLAVLDRFDGASWAASGEFSRVDRSLPDGPDLGVNTETVQQTVTVEALGPGPWLPAADRPVRFQGNAGAIGLAVESATGVLMAEPTALEGLRYTVTSEVPRPTAGQLAALGPPEVTGDMAAFTDVPNLPAEVRELAQQLAGDAQTPYDRLQALQDGLLEGYGYNEDVPSGSSYGRLEQFLIEDRVGYAEQFAAAFATMARSLGYPSRLVYGYLTVERSTADTADTTDTTDTGTGRLLTSITSRQAHVWPEVLLGQSLWVAFEPTPTRVATPPPPGDGTTPAERAAGGIVKSEPSEGSNGAGADNAGAFDSTTAWWSTTLVVLLALIAVLGSVVGGLVLVKRLRRRRRRRRASPTDRVLGAWAEVTDRLIEIGIPLDHTMTARDVLELSSTQVAARASERLGAMVPFVTSALYSPEPPEEAWAREMWEHADAFHHEVLEGLQWYRGPVASLNPRPLLVGSSS
ncbi:MAG: transglutaminaseTgpA domain-containing protein [Acidimicrobiales bacterium]